MNLDRLINPGGIVLLCASGVLSALLEVLLIPLRIGSVLIPVTVVLSIAWNLIVPRVARIFVDTTAAMTATFLAWLLPMLVLSLLPRPEGDVLVRGGGGEQWVYYGVLLGGAVAGTATLVLNGDSRRPPPAQPPATRPAPATRTSQRAPAQRLPTQRPPRQRRPSPRNGR